MSDDAARRWHNDERHRGVGDATSHLAGINELAELATRPDWVAEDPEEHLLPGLRRAAEEAGLTITSFVTTPDGEFTVHVKGASAWSRREVREAAWTVLGAVAEVNSNVREATEHGAVVFDVVTGIPEGGVFATHGHTLRLVIDSAE